MEKSTHKVTGGCMCGAVRYGAPKAHAVVYCHCRDCRRHTGAPAVALAGYTKDDIEWTGDERQIYNSSPGIRRGFCGKCGTPLTWEGHVEELGGDLIEVFIGTTDDPDALVPEFHIHMDERIDWYDTADGLPRYHGWMHLGDEPFSHGPVIKGPSG
jgi:hypothetical protein